MRDVLAIPFFVLFLLAFASTVKELRRIADALEAQVPPVASAPEGR